MLADWFHKHPGGLKKVPEFLSEISTKHPRFFDITGTSFMLLAKSYNAQAKSTYLKKKKPLKLEVLSIVPASRDIIFNVARCFVVFIVIKTIFYINKNVY